MAGGAAAIAAQATAQTATPAEARPVVPAEIINRAAADAYIRVTGEIVAANACRTPPRLLASNMALADEDTEADIQLMSNHCRMAFANTASGSSRPIVSMNMPAMPSAPCAPACRARHIWISSGKSPSTVSVTRERWRGWSTRRSIAWAAAMAMRVMHHAGHPSFAQGALSGFRRMSRALLCLFPLAGAALAATPPDKEQLYPFPAGPNAAPARRRHDEEDARRLYRAMVTSDPESVTARRASHNIGR
jgi:hypothetical protein